jgi:hypothetical protein
MNTFNREVSLVTDALDKIKDKVSREAFNSLLIAIMRLIKSNRPDWGVKASMLIKFNYLYEKESKTLYQIEEMENILEALTNVVDEEEWHIAKKEIRQLLAKANQVKNVSHLKVIEGGQSIIKKGE